ncbi:MAG: hypothetical protein JO319_20965 [Acidobacteriaceae bacterium]|nr:hypothetical protein [Acidobacteriaceae bacterium]
MIGTCKNCGSTESQAIADAKTLGLQQEFQSGVYTCCQLAQWAQEQWAAWFEATHQDELKNRNELSGTADADETETVLVPVRFRQRVPWFRRA